MTTIGVRPSASALRSTKRVCGIGPSNASTTSSTPSTMRRMRSTSPPKSAWPGVSTMLIFVPCQTTDVFLARIVMPRSRSSGLESMTRSGDDLVVAEGAGLPEHLVDERGLAVIDVRDDGDIADFLLFWHSLEI